MTASSLYNMVDSIFIGHIPQAGALAISGLAVTFPLMNISSALGTLVGVGAATIISVLLGQKNYETAGKVLSNEVTLNIIVGLVFTVATLLFMDPILLFFGASQNTLPYARDYMVIISIGNVFTHLYFGLNSVIRSSGNPRLAMNLTLFTVISNAILDPVFIYVLGMGIRGAALATVICQMAALAYTLYYFFDRKKFLHLDRRRPLQLDWRIAKDSLAIGMGPFLMNLASCIVVLFINNQLLKYGGDLAIGAYGIANRISFLIRLTRSRKLHSGRDYSTIGCDHSSLAALNFLISFLTLLNEILSFLSNLLKTFCHHHSLLHSKEHQPKILLKLFLSDSICCFVSSTTPSSSVIISSYSPALPSSFERPLSAASRPISEIPPACSNLPIPERTFSNSSSAVSLICSPCCSISRPADSTCSLKARRRS